MSLCLCLYFVKRLIQYSTFVKEDLRRKTMFIGKKKESRRALKILMVMTANLNLGDSVLSENDYYLIQKALRGRKAHIFKYGISTRDISQVRYVDAVIFAGGILKTFNEKFWLYIPEIIEFTKRTNIEK